MVTCRALLFGGLKESRPECSEVELKDTNALAFEVLLRYIYTGRIRLLDLKVSHSLLYGRLPSGITSICMLWIKCKWAIPHGHRLNISISVLLLNVLCIAAR